MTRVLVIGPGPAVIGEGGELDAAAAGAVRTLRARGHEVILVTSNPATVASDPLLADRTYLEPLDLGALRAVIATEKPALVLPIFGGAKALELALALHDDGTLQRAGARLIGAPAKAISAALADAALAPAKRAALGECSAGSSAWSTFEVVAAVDESGAFLPVCTIESLDRASVHPGDAVAVTPPIHAPATLIAELHEAARAAIAASGLHSGIATCDLVLRRSDDAIHAISVTLGATRSAALAAQATGYPVTDVAVDLALGSKLADLTAAKGASAPSRAPEPRGVVVRWPRFAFETFPDADAALGAHRKSLGESLGVGDTLADALRSAARGVEDGLAVARPVKRSSATPSSKKVLVLGAGPSRIGQGAELATCASEVLVALRELDHVPVFLDSSVESTAVAASVADHVHVEAVTLERVLASHDRDHAAGVIVQVGGETALRLAAELTARGVHVFGSTPAALARAIAAADDDARLDDAALDEAIAVDVDAVSDGRRVVIAGVMEHLEPAFVHGGDAAAILPAFTLNPEIVARIEDRVRAIALESGVIGLLGVRLAVAGHDIVVLDVEPRAGRTTAFVTRATGFPLVRIATKVMLGKTLDELGISERPLPRHVAARERVFPFERLGVDPALGREMRSTGEVIGLDDTPARAYAKALRGIGISLRAPAGSSSSRDVTGEPSAPRGVLLSTSERDTSAAVDLARRFRAIGFEVHALGGVRAALAAARIPFRDAGSDDLGAITAEIRARRIAFAVVTARGDVEIARTRVLRAATLEVHIPCFTTLRLARLGCSALEEDATPRVRTLQAWYAADD
ncbi:MAG: carbamoyl-phosphate synthase large subunit [Myxococcales bacterium]|nr:carbamoyl-phosphate synthase large subunit [Myxococcales bacterium]